MDTELTLVDGSLLRVPATPVGGWVPISDPRPVRSADGRRLTILSTPQLLSVGVWVLVLVFAVAVLVGFWNSRHLLLRLIGLGLGGAFLAAAIMVLFYRGRCVLSHGGGWLLYRRSPWARRVYCPLEDLAAVQLVQAGSWPVDLAEPLDGIGDGYRPVFELNLALADGRRLPITRLVGPDRITRLAEEIADFAGCPLLRQVEPEPPSDAGQVNDDPPAAAGRQSARPTARR